MPHSAAAAWHAAPMLAVELPAAPPQPVRNPADRRDIVGQVREAGADEVEAALRCAVEAAPAWAATSPAERAAALERAAEHLEVDIDRLVGLLMREAGKTAANAVAEVREAVDFLRYYALQVRRDFDNGTHRPLGPVLCISPWNFPLAIFTGQVAAALAAGNVVLAKPAEQTPLVAAEAVRVLHTAGVPRGALQLLPGRGETVGAPLAADARVMGVLFTGSTEVARLLQRQLAQRSNVDGRPVPLIAETGGQNAMLVDSSALVEQVVVDVLASAFDSAGQRCSALRVLCVQHETADRVFEMLEGAVRELRLGNPAQLAVDVGPVIDAEAQATIQRHIETMRAAGRRVVQPVQADADVLRRGSFVPPTLIEIHSLAELQREVFGPVLHFLRYQREQLDALLGQVNATGYALTMGLHTRIDETIARVAGHAHAGNLYVNRNMVGAVVGVQPFGGNGLSGTGPKAGGPLYLLRLLTPTSQRRGRSGAAVQRRRGGGAARCGPDPRSAGRWRAAARAARMGGRTGPRQPRGRLRGLRGARAGRGDARAARPHRRIERLPAAAARHRALPGRGRGRSPGATGGGTGGAGPRALAGGRDRTGRALAGRGARTRRAGAGLVERHGALRCRAAPWRCRGAPRALPAHRRACRPHRRRGCARCRSAGHSAGATGDGARAQRQHGRGRRQCEPDDHRLTPQAASVARGQLCSGRSEQAPTGMRRTHSQVTRMFVSSSSTKVPIPLPTVQVVPSGWMSTTTL